MLKQELEELRLEDVTLSDTGYVYGRLPATKGLEGKKKLCFIAHMDTAPDFSGENVKPQIIPDYDGKDVVLKGTGDILKVADFPELPSLKGRTLITTDGTTLLGADDKAGIAVITEVLRQIVKDNIPHGAISVVFTPDEEIGEGADNFELEKAGADIAYTIDGDYEGEVAYENFNASGATFTVNGVSVHPGSAKGIMKNAALIASEIANMLPFDETPAHTEGREGFFHLTDISGDVSGAKLHYIIRDHDAVNFERRVEKLKKIEEAVNTKYGAGTCELSVKESYRNMLEIIEKDFYPVELAKQAIREEGLEPVSNPVRGGTDGARLSFMGLPCPNLGAGGYGFHGPFEHVTLEGMESSVRIVLNVIRLVA
jgi:tripeptide aminopeptidase